MRDGGLIDRLDRAGTARNEAAPPVHKLDAVARTLREAVDRTARSLVLERKDVLAPRPAPPPEAQPSVRADRQLPQILQHPPRGNLVPASGVTEPIRAQMLAPAILLGSLLAVGALMSASLTHTGWLASAPRPKLTEPIERLAGGHALAPGEITLVAADETPAPVATSPAGAGNIDLRTLLESCERMIAAGDMAGARRELARAAEGGNAGARFALAETFDPNVLAAWGLRDRVADVGVARTLYEQALADGDARAHARIEALSVD